MNGAIAADARLYAVVVAAALAPIYPALAWVQRLLNEAARRFGPPDVATMSDEVLDTHLAAESARAGGIERVRG